MLPDYCLLGYGISPNGEKAFPFYLDLAAIAKIEEDGPEWKFYASEIVESVVAEPVAILEGLNRKEYEGGFCYFNVPSYVYDNTGARCAIDPRMVFVVFVVVKQDRLTVMDWALRQKDETSYPDGWREDFTGGQVWPTKQH